VNKNVYEVVDGVIAPILNYIFKDENFLGVR
jgi:hypothetical protein